MANVKKQITGARNRDAGALFESMIDGACIAYEERGVAKIEKTPEPMRIIRPLGDGQYILDGDEGVIWPEVYHGGRYCGVSGPVGLEGVVLEQCTGRRGRQWQRSVKPVIIGRRCRRRQTAATIC